MAKAYVKALFIHRRDLRVQDNTALNAARTEAESVLSCFILDPVQVGKDNEYRSQRHVDFMIDSLDDLQDQYAKSEGELHIFKGDPAEVLKKIIEKDTIDAVFINADYTPYSSKRDASLKAVCDKAGIPLLVPHDLLLSGNPDEVKTGGDKPYTVFTPYWKRAQQVRVPKPVALKAGEWATSSIKTVTATELHTLRSKEKNAAGIFGGRKEGRSVLGKAGEFRSYARDHNTPSKSTTRLSAHMKFGTVSVREAYHSFGLVLGYEHPIIRQLYWRDFYTMLVHFFPKVIGASFMPQHEIIYDTYNKEATELWMKGETGIPIVDAGMRELAETGYMHNRVRLIVGSFLTKDLHQPWWIGEKYFAQQLVDYDLSVNNGNWQWVGGTGADPVPYFRIFNPWLQGKKFDPDATYIKKWVPELADLSAKEIHLLHKNSPPEGVTYPRPMLDHTEEMRKIRALYSKPESV